MSIATVLVVPTMSEKAKLYMIVQYAIGLTSSAIFSSRDKDKYIERNFTWYTMESTKRARFTNRASAVAAVMLYTHARAFHIKDDIIPSKGEWDKYRSALDTIATNQTLKDNIKKEISDSIKANGTVFDIADILSNNIADLRNITGRQYDVFPRRLVADIAEAFQYVYCA